MAQHKKLSFPLRISSVNMTKPQEAANLVPGDLITFNSTNP